MRARTVNECSTNKMLASVKPISVSLYCCLPLYFHLKDREEEAEGGEKREMKERKMGGKRQLYISIDVTMSDEDEEAAG